MADSKYIADKRSDRDLLVRIDERVFQLSNRMKAVEDAIKTVPTYIEKVKTLERLVYGVWAFCGSIAMYIIYEAIKDKL